MKKEKCGFTLVELIVVITIMMVATMVGVVSFQSTSQKSRDGRRVSDLEKIRIALEMYRQNYSGYPLNASTTLVTQKLLQAWPIDPKGNAFAVYTYTRGAGTSYTYTLDAKMENMGSTTPTCVGCASGYNYQVTNP